MHWFVLSCVFLGNVLLMWALLQLRLQSLLDEQAQRIETAWVTPDALRRMR